MKGPVEPALPPRASHLFTISASADYRSQREPNGTKVMRTFIGVTQGAQAGVAPQRRACPQAVRRSPGPAAWAEAGTGAPSPGPGGRRACPGRVGPGGPAGPREQALVWGLSQVTGPVWGPVSVPARAEDRWKPPSWLRPPPTREPPAEPRPVPGSQGGQRGVFQAPDRSRQPRPSLGASRMIQTHK